MLGITSNLLCVVTVLQLMCLVYWNKIFNAQNLKSDLSSNDIISVHVHGDTSYVQLVVNLFMRKIDTLS